MTIDKMVHYIGNQHIVNNINSLNETELTHRLQAHKNEIQFRLNNGLFDTNQVPMNWISEQELIQYRLRQH